MIVCGIMTGTSLDGIDIAVCRFGENPSITSDFELLFCDVADFPIFLKNKLAEIISGKAISLKDLSQLNFAYSKVISEAVKLVCQKNNFDLKSIELIGLHGQTVWHNPKAENFCGIETASTLQIGSGTALSAILDIPVADDFRSADIALGGEGAPLVPIFDFNFFKSSSENVIALNVGGIANITYMPMNCDESQVTAFDVGPGNTLIDLAAMKHFDLQYDAGGSIARTGKLIDELFDNLSKTEFIRQEPPKSTGRELFDWGFVEQYLEKEHKPEDILRTLTEFTVFCIAENVKRFASESSKIIVSGGGERNQLMMELLSEALPDSKITSSSSLGIPSDAKEAIAFAYLAWRNIKGLHGNITSVTGAVRNTILGAVSGKRRCQLSEG